MWYFLALFNLPIVTTLQSQSLTVENGVYISSLQSKITSQSRPRSHLKLVKIVDPTSNVYIILLCPENFINDTGTALNLVTGTDNLCTGTGRFSSFFGIFLSFVPWTHFDRKQTNYTTPSANPVRTTTGCAGVNECGAFWQLHMHPISDEFSRTQSLFSKEKVRRI